MNAFVKLFPVTQRLAATLSFYDAFREKPGVPPFIRTPLRVSIPSHDWRAHDLDGAGIYRFAYPRRIVLPDSFEVRVEDPAGTYVDHDPLLLALPLPVSVPPVRSDFWFIRPLWPTRTFTVPPGETAIVGRIHSPTAKLVAGLSVQMHLAPVPTPATPYTRTDENGEFLFRFPSLPGPVPAGTETLHITVTDPSSMPVPVTPLTVSAKRGARQFFEFARN